MNRLLSSRASESLKNPVFWFALLLVVLSLFKTLRDDPNYIIRSDGRGYYAYLPALIIFNDSSFESSVAAEQEYIGKEADPLYLVKTENGLHNKYFPGVAVLQTPFFILATGISWISGAPINGYSEIYSYCFYFGSLIYALLGLFFFYRVFLKLFPAHRKIIQWLVPAFYISTPILFYSSNMASFSHLYSVFLFGWFSWMILRLKEQISARRMFLTGLILGLIFLVRPTNILVVLAIPLLFSDKAELLTTLRAFKKKHLLLGVLGGAIMFCLLLLIWKWESGNWFVWSYGGEGFTFLSPQLWGSLFSLRVGLFVHTPILVLSLIGVLIFIRSKQFASISWLIYFLANAWVISSWWCWDYESPFGNRPYTEHLIFLLLPMIWLAIKYRKIVPIILIATTFLGILRLWAFNSEFMTNQRFTSSNYFSSLAVWSSNNKGRWNYTSSCKPHGQLISSELLLDAPELFNADSNTQFIYTVEAPLHQPRVNERFYYRVALDKKDSDEPFGGVYLVVDAQKNNSDKRYYFATELFNDRLAKDEWQSLEFQGIIHDNLQEYDKVGIYIWNLEKRSFKLRNVRIILEEYKN